MNEDPSSTGWGTRFRWVLIGFTVIGAFFLLAEHRAHVLPFLPWLLLAACPLLHVFMHGGHGHEGHGESGRAPRRGESAGATNREPHEHGGTQ